MYKFDETDLNNLQKVKEITLTDYKLDENGCMSGEDMASIIDELLYEIEDLKQSNKETESYYQSNWKPSTYQCNEEDLWR